MRSRFAPNSSKRSGGAAACDATRRRCRTCLAAALVVGSSGVAHAQQDPLPLDRFVPAWAGDRFFGVPSPYAAGHLLPHVMLIGDYAHNPLVLQRETSDGNIEDLGAVVEHQLFLHVNATFPLFDYVALNVDLPTALYQAGESPVVGTTTFTSPNVVQLGDLAVGLRGRFWGEYHEPFQIGVGATLWVPTGPADAGAGDFVGSGSVRGLFQLLVGGRVEERFVWSAALGPQIGPALSYSNIAQGTTFSWGLGGGLLLGDERDWQVSVELPGLHHGRGRADSHDQLRSAGRRQVPFPRRLRGRPRRWSRAHGRRGNPGCPGRGEHRLHAQARARG